MPVKVTLTNTCTQAHKQKSVAERSQYSKITFQKFQLNTVSQNSEIQDKVQIIFGLPCILIFPYFFLTELQIVKTTV